ncbi:hypothetical protein HX039_16890 [Myroides marinus]|uniref:hypothetical protein n=1 Tax=Myroides marinus TaxID=703342 RepID=UPI002575CE53|nr:hypothetical protein [Myroides marinus]MDM1405757.1 hypothetical protein [Myroides marinus]
MKKVLAFMLMSLSMIATGCSSSDDNNSSNDGSLRSKIVGKWYVSKDAGSNSYEYKGNGTAEYINYYQGNKEVYQGKWKLLKDNVLIEAYAEPGEKLDKDWETYPDMSNTVILVNDKELHLQPDYRHPSDPTPSIIYYKK